MTNTVNDKQRVYELLLAELKNEHGTSREIADRLGLDRKRVAIYLYHMVNDDLKRIVIIDRRKGTKGTVPVFDLTSKHPELRQLRKITFGNNR